jgi:hypothetical protein
MNMATEITTTQQVLVTETALNVIELITPGPQGPPGSSGTSGGSPTFIQATQPSAGQISGLTTYAWWDTSGNDLTLWIEDGLS